MKKLLGLVVFTVLAFVGVQRVQAVGQLTAAKDTLSNPLAGAASTHTFTLKPSTTSNVRAIRFQFCTTPSGGCVKPAGLSTANTVLVGDGVTGSVTGNAGAFSLDKSTNGNIFVHAADGASNSNADTLVVPITLVTNSAIDNCEAGGQTSTDTCYVLVTTYSDNGATTAVDTTIISYTVVANVVVSARVDPTFTFVVGSVPAGQVDNTITTSVASDFNTLPFGNLTSGVPKYAAHKLNVTTNTQGGYTVDVLMQTQLTGVYGANNIDAFTTAWATPGAWGHPSGNSPSVDTGWFGANTTDGDVSANWLAAQGTAAFGGVALNTPVTVMKSTISDNGSNAVYVTYAVEANVFQPADTYTGAVVYNALPTY